MADQLTADELEQRREMVDRLVAASKADREQRESDSCDRIESHDAVLERLRAKRDEARKIHDGLVGQIAAMSLELIEVRGELDRARPVLTPSRRGVTPACGRLDVPRTLTRWARPDVRCSKRGTPTPATCPQTATEPTTMSDNDPISEMRKAGRSLTRSFARAAAALLFVTVVVLLTPPEGAKTLGVVALASLTLVAAYGVWESRRYIAREVAELSAAIACAKGICGDVPTPALGGGTLICDLNANHRGWHGCQIPGSSERTSWTHRGVSP